MSRPSLAIRAFVGVLGMAALACTFLPCEVPSEELAENVPARLSQTGLYTDLAAGVLAPAAEAYAPRFELWSDGASKRRWLWLPPGAQIDTSDMDAWQFPVGTKFWKEFTRDEVRVETRLLQRQPSGWIGVAYLWQRDGTDAIAAPYGAIDAAGTPHDVPASNECDACHGGRSSYVLGFSALQLAMPAEPDSLNLDELIRLDLVSDIPPATPRVPGNETEQAALGYLHANCSHCHNGARPQRDGSRCFDPDSDIDFFVRAAEGSNVAETATYRTAKDVCFEPGQPDESAMLELMGQRGRFRQMPPLATEVVDAPAITQLRRWIEAM